MYTPPKTTDENNSNCTTSHEPIITSVKEWNKQISSLLRVVTLSDIKEDPTLNFSTPELRELCINANGYVPLACINGTDTGFVVYEYYHTLNNTILDLGILQAQIAAGTAFGGLMINPELYMKKGDKIDGIIKLEPENVAISVLSVKEIYNGLFVTFKISSRFFSEYIRGQLGDIETPRAHGFPMHLFPMVLNFINDSRLVRFNLTLDK